MDYVIDAAFIVVVIGFLKAQFGLAGKGALIGAFVIALLFGLAPLLAQFVPAAAPFVDVFLKTFILFLGAAGSYDTVTGFIQYQNAQKR